MMTMMQQIRKARIQADTYNRLYTRACATGRLYLAARILVRYQREGK